MMYLSEFTIDLTIIQIEVIYIVVLKFEAIKKWTVRGAESKPV